MRPPPSRARGGDIAAVSQHGPAGFFDVIAGWTLARTAAVAVELQREGRGQERCQGPHCQARKCLGRHLWVAAGICRGGCQGTLPGDAAWAAASARLVRCLGCRCRSIASAGAASGDVPGSPLPGPHSRDTVAELQQSALVLVGRMIALTDESGGGERWLSPNDNALVRALLANRQRPVDFEAETARRVRR